MKHKVAEIRKSQRTCFCRGCDREIKPGMSASFTYSRRNRGQKIIFCIPCVEALSAALNTEFTNLTIEVDNGVYTGTGTSESGETSKVSLESRSPSEAEGIGDHPKKICKCSSRKVRRPR